MSTNFDLTIENYSTDDLLSLLGLGSNPSITEVNNKINIFINMFKGISGENSKLIVNFFQGVGERLYRDLFEDIDINSINYLNYSQPFQVSTGSSASYPFPSLSSGDNDLNGEELVGCRDVEVDTAEMISSLQIDPIKYSSKHINYICSTRGIQPKSSLEHERTVFRYNFSEDMNNVKELYLSKIILPLPYTISNFKNNNQFTITDVSANIPHVIDICDNYLIYYTDILSLVAHLNDKHFNNIDNSDNILGSITLEAKEAGSGRWYLKFSLPSPPPSKFSTFSISFDMSLNNSCVVWERLHSLLGFPETQYNNKSVLIGNSIFLRQPKFYFSIDDGQVNYDQNLQVIGLHTLTNFVLGTIYLNAADLAANDHIIYNMYNTNEATQHSRIYNGLVDLKTIIIRIYDSFGNLQQIPKEGFDPDTFSITLKITQHVADVNNTLLATVGET